MKSHLPIDPTGAFACVQIPGFPAWAMAREAGSAGEIVVLQGSRVAAATRRARRSGVEEGMGVQRARVLAPGAQVRARDHQLEQAVWEDVLCDLLAATPRIESVGPGTATLGRPGGEALRSAVSELGARAAIASDRATAVLGAARSAPGHVLSIDPEHRRSFLKRFETSLLGNVGFDSDMVEALGLFGYTNLSSAATLTKRQLAAQFGKEGERLYSLLHPPKRDREVVSYEPPAYIRASVELDPPCCQPAELYPALDHVVNEAACSLDRVHTRRISVRLSCAGEEFMASRVLFEAVQDPSVLRRAARYLLTGLLETKRDVDRLDVELGGLSPATPAQAHLFDERPSVYMALRGVNRKFPGAIMRAVIVEALFPEQGVRYEPFI